MRVWCGALALGLVACGSAEGDSDRTVGYGGGAAGPDGGGVNVTMPNATDDAVVVSASFPAALECGASDTAKVTVRNTGTSTWTLSDGFALGAVGDEDPLHAGGVRVRLSGADAVPPGGEHTFDVALAAPMKPLTYTTDWQMVHEKVRWFGGVAKRDVVVDAKPIDLSKAKVLNSPDDVATWAETAKITGFDMDMNGVRIDFTKRDGGGSWPDVPFGQPGDSLEYTLWIVIEINGQWYTSGCIQYWRGLDRNGGPPSGYAANWYYDPNRWGPMTTHQPVVGERVGFFVTAGNARNVTDHSGSQVFERSNVITIPFPADPGANFTY